MSRAGSDRRPCCVKCACVCHCAVSLCCVWLCPIWSRHNNHFKLSQTQPLGNSWSGVQSPCWVTNTHLHAALPILSQIMRDRVAHILAWWQIFIRTPTVLLTTTKGKPLPCLTLASTHNPMTSLLLFWSISCLLLRGWLRTGRFTLKWVCGCWESRWQINRAQQRKDVPACCVCQVVYGAGGDFGADPRLLDLPIGCCWRGVKKKAAYRCEVNRFIMSSLIRSVYVLN